MRNHVTWFWIVYKRCRRRQRGEEKKRDGEVIQLSQTVREFVLLRVVRLARVGVGPGPLVYGPSGPRCWTECGSLFGAGRV